MCFFLGNLGLRLDTAAAEYFEQGPKDFLEKGADGQLQNVVENDENNKVQVEESYSSCEPLNDHHNKAFI